MVSEGLYMEAALACTQFEFFGARGEPLDTPELAATAVCRIPGDVTPWMVIGLSGTLEVHGSRAYAVVACGVRRLLLVFRGNL